MQVAIIRHLTFLLAERAEPWEAVIYLASYLVRGSAVFFIVHVTGLWPGKLGGCGRHICLCGPEMAMAMPLTETDPRDA